MTIPRMISGHRQDQAAPDLLASLKTEPGQHIGRRRRDQKHNAAGNDRIQQRVSEEYGYVLRLPGIDIILKMKSAFKLEHGSGKDLSGGGKTGSQDPEQEHCGEQHPDRYDQISGKQGQLSLPVNLFFINNFFFFPFAHVFLHFNGYPAGISLSEADGF